MEGQLGKFIYKVVYISIIYLAIIIVIILIANKISKVTMNLELNNSINTLVVGDSRSVLGFDDTKFSNIKNFSEHSTSLFFNKVKIRELLSRNPQINDVILSLQYNDFNEKRDRWTKDYNIIKYKLRNTYSLFRWEDLTKLISLSPIATLKSIPPTIFFSLKNSYREFGNIGEYKCKDGILLAKTNNLIHSHKISDIQVESFNEILKICKDNNVNLTVIILPVHSELIKELRPFKNQFHSIVNGQVDVDNYLTLFKSDSLFYDKGHINCNGSKKFSNDIIKNNYAF